MSRAAASLVVIDAYGRRRAITLAAGARTWASIGGAHPFAALVAAFNRAEVTEAESLAPRLLDAGCVEICCVGSEAEAAHDAIDAVIEDREAVDVLTTFDADVSEGCAYFLDLSGGECARLIAVVGDHPEVEAELRAAMTRRRG